MKFNLSLFFTFACCLIPILGYAENDEELKRQVGTIPGLIIIGLFVLVQLVAFTSALIYYSKGDLRSQVLSLIPTIITLIVTVGIMLLQQLRPNSDLTPFLYFISFLCVVLCIILAGRRKHSLSYVNRYSLPPPLEKIWGQDSRKKAEVQSQSQGQGQGQRRGKVSL